MSNNIHIKVYLWDEEIGRLAWDETCRTVFFLFNPKYTKNRPDLSSISFSVKNRPPLLPIYPEEGKIYKQLPAFLADSLSDIWGSQFIQWCKENHIRKSDITPLERLAYAGRTGMGALEFVPEFFLRDSKDTKTASLEALSEKAYKERDALQIGKVGEATIETLRHFGSPLDPDGRGKIVVDVDKDTGYIVSGQTGMHKNHFHFILKFGCKEVSSAEIEMTYYAMCLAAGIEMMDSRLVVIDGTKHFLTMRFDRKNGQKLHMQTLAAMDPSIHSYEGLLSLCRKLSLPEKDYQELFRRMVFNILANNTDDHTRNFSFIREKEGPWRLSPAYDMNYIFYKNICMKNHILSALSNINQENQMTKHAKDIIDGKLLGNTNHCLSVRGKYSDFNKEDLLVFADENGIRSAEIIIKQVTNALMNFRILAEKYEVKPYWAGRIDDTLRMHLFNFRELIYDIKFSYIDQDSNVIRDAQILSMDNGAYLMRAMVNGILIKKIIPINVPLNIILSEKGVTRMTEKEMHDLVMDELMVFAKNNIAVRKASELLRNLARCANEYVHTGQGFLCLLDLFNKTHLHIIANNKFSGFSESELLHNTTTDLIMSLEGLLNESEKEELKYEIENSLGIN